MTYGEDGDPDKESSSKRPYGRKEGNSGKPKWRAPWESAGGMVVNPDAMLLDEPAVVSPSLTLTGDTDDDDGQEVWT